MRTLGRCVFDGFVDASTIEVFLNARLFWGWQAQLSLWVLMVVTARPTVISTINQSSSEPLREEFLNQPTRPNRAQCDEREANETKWGTSTQRALV